MSNEKIYRKIKRSGITGTLILYLVLCALAVGVFLIAGQAFIEYTLDTKFSAEYDADSYMKRIYESGISSGYDTDTVCSLLEAEERDFIIIDGTGRILHLYGRDTRDEELRTVRISEISPEIEIYGDRELPYVYPNKRGNLTIDFSVFQDMLGSNTKFFLLTDEPDDIDDRYDAGIDFSGQISYYSENGENERFVELPFWISFDIGSRGEKLITKAWFSFNVKDLLLLIKIAGALVLLILVILIVSLIGICRSFKRQKRIVNYFFTDPVTGGRNNMWYQIRGDQLLKKWSNRNNNYAVVSLLMVNFRNYCVCHSVADGDRLLGRINTEICSSISRKEMCAHNSSSGFALILRYDNTEELKQRLDSLIGRLEKIEPGHRFNFQAGISLIDRMLNENGKPISRKSISLQHEYNNASTARSTLSESDESGIAFFDEKIVEDQKWLDNVQEQQTQAIANEEFLVYYQPKYDPCTNELRGAEALIRWQSPIFGFVAPYRFIPIFEKNGFITEIDHYMLSHVAHDQRRWLSEGYKCVPVSVNVSRAHFIESDLAEQIRDIVDSAGCPHELIEIELTESAFFDDKKAMIETINKLKSYGFSVSMDDFGAGYSSLNSLKDMPLDVLKLDADFFRGESSDGRGEIVVSEAIKLAKSLNMRIVAEGVEIREQVDFLAGEGCDMIQGYYFAKPMPGNDYELRMGQDPDNRSFSRDVTENTVAESSGTEI